jgi:putative PIN family toxin of toxin-antitoxin system
MIVVLDSNILFSSLISRHGNPGRIYDAWIERSFDLATCIQQTEEIRAASRSAKLVRLLNRNEVGEMMNSLHRAIVIDQVPRKYSVADPTDAFLMDLAFAASAQFLVTGDKRSGLLQLGKIDGIRIVSANQFCTKVLRLK